MIKFGINEKSALGTCRWEVRTVKNETLVVWSRLSILRAPSENWEAMALLGKSSPYPDSQSLLLSNVSHCWQNNCSVSRRWFWDSWRLKTNSQTRLAAKQKPWDPFVQLHILLLQLCRKTTCYNAGPWANERGCRWTIQHAHSQVSKVLSASSDCWYCLEYWFSVYIAWNGTMPIHRLILCSKIDISTVDICSSTLCLDAVINSNAHQELVAEINTWSFPPLQC